MYLNGPYRIFCYLKFRFSKKATKFETISHMIWRSLSFKCQIKWEIVSNFCGLFRMSELYQILCLFVLFLNFLCYVLCFMFHFFFYFFFHQGRVEMKWLPLPAQQQLFPNRIHKILAWWATFTAKTWRLLREALVVSSIEQKRAWQSYELCHAPRHSLMNRMHSYDLW